MNSNCQSNTDEIASKSSSICCLAATAVQRAFSTTMASTWATPRSIQLSKAAGERLGINLAVHHLQTSDGVVVSSVARSSPLSGLVFPGDRILSLNGLALSASELAGACVAKTNIDLLVASPLAVRAKAKSSMLDAAKSITSRHAVAASQRAVFAAFPVNAL